MEVIAKPQPLATFRERIQLGIDNRCTNAGPNWCAASQLKISVRVCSMAIN